MLSSRAAMVLVRAAENETLQPHTGLQVQPHKDHKYRDLFPSAASAAVWFVLKLRQPRCFSALIIAKLWRPICSPHIATTSWPRHSSHGGHWLGTKQPIKHIKLSKGKAYSKIRGCIK